MPGMTRMDDRIGLETSERLVGIELGKAARDRLCHFVALLRSWQRAKNLVSKDTLDAVWTRHIADGLQVLPLIRSWAEETRRAAGPGNGIGEPGSVGKAPAVLRIMDLGSGAGLPGLVLALAGADWTMLHGPDSASRVTAAPKLDVTLVEANGRKASFLRTVSRETGAPVTVINRRIETLHTSSLVPTDLITARALAPLSKLVGLADPWMSRGATAFFHKGGEYAGELDDWTDADAHVVVEHVSVVDPNSRILQITRRARRDQG
jgi:16S rRNA (guanine527-N7)-methyltransferase